jgi:hypothetical protein
MKRTLRVAFAMTLGVAAYPLLDAAAPIAGLAVGVAPTDCRCTDCACGPAGSCGCEVRRAPAGGEPSPATPPTATVASPPYTPAALLPDPRMSLPAASGRSAAVRSCAVAPPDRDLHLLVVLQV